MNKIVIIVTGILLASCSGNEEKAIHIEEQITKEVPKEIPLMAQHKVETKTATAYEFKFGEPVEKGVKMYQTTYDQQGNLIDSVVYNNNIVAYREKYEYNEKNELIKRLLLDSAENVLQRSERSFDANGNESEFFLYSGDSLYYKQKKEYNDKQELIKLTEYDSHGKAKLISLFEYNDAGKMIAETETNASGTKLAKIAYAYDAEGNRISITNYNSGGISEGKTLLKNFDNGNAQLVEKYDAYDSLYASYQYEYDETGNETKNIIFNGIGQIIRQSNSTYDKNGNKIQFEIYEGEVGFLGKDVSTYNENNQETELIVYDDKNKQVKRKANEFNDIGLLYKETTYNKVDEPIYQFTYTYTHFK